MTIKPNSDFLVKPGEAITVTVRASDTEYLARITELSFGNWVTPNVPPEPLAEVRTFVMPAVSINSFGIQFFFLPPPGVAPANYHVNIVGSEPGGTPFDDDISAPDPPSPLPPDRGYRFVTS